MTEDRIRELLREMRDEPVPPESLARVRLDVSRRTEARGWLEVFWKPAVMFAVAACLLVAIFSVRRPHSVPTEPTKAAAVPSSSETALQPAPATRPTPRKRVAASRPARTLKPSVDRGGATLIRIETPDPDVVILLIGEE